MLRRWTLPACIGAIILFAVGSTWINGQAVSKAKATSTIQAKKPVLGAACKSCPWGALADVVQKAMKPYGFDVQICNFCSMAEAPRLVAGAKMPPPWKPSTNPNIPAYLIPRPPDAPIDFGIAASLRIWQAYQGTHDYGGEAPHKNLRLIANLQNPNYIAVAAKADLGITDLSQVKQKHWPIRILAQNWPEIKEILAYYGLTEEAVKAAGGTYVVSDTPEARQNFDIIIHNAALGNAPEYNIWLEVTQKYDLRFLNLPNGLLDEVAKDNENDRGTIPLWLFRGVDRPIPTVVQTGNAIYCRDDTPDDFAYAVAKAMDEHQDLLQWSHLNFYYDVHQVGQDRGLPLHPGAARYYRERGYIK